MNPTIKNATLATVFIKGEPDIVETKDVWTLSVRRVSDTIPDPMVVYGFNDPQPATVVVDRVVKLLNDFFPGPKGRMAGDQIRPRLKEQIATMGKDTDESFFINTETDGYDGLLTLIIAVHIPSPNTYVAEVAIGKDYASGYMSICFARHMTKIDLENGKVPPIGLEELDVMEAEFFKTVIGGAEDLHAEHTSAYKFRNNDFKLLDVYGSGVVKQMTKKGWDQYMQSIGHGSNDVLIMLTHVNPVSFDRIMERLADRFSTYFPKQLLGKDITPMVMDAVRQVHKGNDGANATLHYRGTLRGLSVPMCFHIAIHRDEGGNRYSAELAAGCGKGVALMQNCLLSYANSERLSTDPVVTAEMLDGMTFH